MTGYCEQVVNSSGIIRTTVKGVQLSATHVKPNLGSCKILGPGQAG